MNKTGIGQRIREERKKHHYTLDAFSTKIGIGKIYLGEIERGAKMPSLKVFEKIVNGLEDVPADYLLRDYVITGKPYAINEINQKLEGLTPHQIKMIGDVIDALVVNFESEDSGEDLEYDE